MSPVLPKFRSDLLVSPRGAGEDAHYIIKDPVSGEFFRFRQAEHFITSLCDGQRTPEEIRGQVEQYFGAPLPAEMLNNFLRMLAKNGLLEDKATTGSAKPAQRRVRGSLLYFRFKIFDPDRLFNWLIPKIRFFFTPQFVLFSGLTILLAAIVAVLHADEFGWHLQRLYHFSSVPLLIAVIFFVVGAHEFAHGLTCKYFGGEVHEIGGMFIYFQPALYCNVSDAWLFREKSKRLWVAFAGPYFELFIWALATLVWRVTDVDTWFNYAAFVIMASSGIKTLINFNPLVKLDGYYLLSDYLEIPNLRQRSFQYIGTLLKRAIGSAVAPMRALTPRERRIFLMYGLVSTVCSFSLLAYVTFKAGGFLVDQHQPLSFGLFIGLVGIKLHQRFRRLIVQKPVAPEQPEPQRPQPEPAANNPLAGAEPCPSTGRGFGQRWRGRKLEAPATSWRTSHVSAKGFSGQNNGVAHSEAETMAVVAQATIENIPNMATTTLAKANGHAATNGLAGTTTRELTAPKAKLESHTSEATQTATLSAKISSVIHRPTVSAIVGPALAKSGSAVTIPPSNLPGLAGLPLNTPARAGGSGSGSETAAKESSTRGLRVAPSRPKQPEKRVEQLPQKPEPAPAPKTESPTPALPRKSKPSRLLPVLKWIVVIGIMGAALFYVRMDVRVAGEFVVLPNPDSDARASVEGIVEEINVNEGSSVRKGELLARLADTDLRAELAKTQALAEQARAKLKLLQVGPTTEEIAVAKSGVARSEDTLKYARSRVERNQPLFQKKIVSAKDFEDMQEQVTAAENAVKEAASKLALLVKGTRPEDIHAAEAELARCEAQRAYIETQLSMLEIRSPARGVVATPSRQLMELKHQYVKRGDLIARVYDLSKMTADIIVSEKEIADVKPGQKVYIRTRAYPGMTFEGTVQKIAISAQGGAAPGASAGLAAGAPANGKTILVTTDIDNSTLLLKPGMTGEAKIIGSERTLFDLLTRRLVRTVKVEFWSWW